MDFFPTDDFHALIYWCLLIFLISFFVGMQWVVVRVLLPLHRLTEAAHSIMTGELPNFNQPMGGIREIDQLRAALRHMTEQIRLSQQREADYRVALTETQENERKRIAREIHDETIQSLVVISHSIERAGRSIGDGAAAIHSYLETARRQINGVVDSLRQLIANLRPTVLDELGLVAAIEVLCETYRLVIYRVIGKPIPLTHAQELALFRAAQEAVRNAYSHAHAQHILVTLTYDAQTVTLNVNDDGVGFSVPRHWQEWAAGGHYGLIGIRERVGYLGGRLRLMSAMDCGTQLIVDLPVATATE